MNRYGVSATLAGINIVAVIWFTMHCTVGADAMFAAILAGVIGSAIVQRIFVGRDGGWKARLDPVVALSFIVCFDAALFLAAISKHG